MAGTSPLETNVSTHSHSERRGIRAPTLLGKPLLLPSASYIHPVAHTMP